MNTSVRRTLHLPLLLILITVQLHNSCAAPKGKRQSTTSPRNNGTVQLSSPTPTPAAPCVRFVANITLSREGCSPSTIEVPTCSGACNSFVHYVTTSPHKQSQCSCCQPTNYRIAKRTARFQCAGGTIETVTFFVSVAQDCNCSSCGQVPTLSHIV
eukprot:Em0021g380a